MHIPNAKSELRCFESIAYKYTIIHTYMHRHIHAYTHMYRMQNLNFGVSQSIHTCVDTYTHRHIYIHISYMHVPNAKSELRYFQVLLAECIVNPSNPRIALMRTCMYVCMYICMYVFLYEHILMFVCVCILMYIVCMYPYVYVYMGNLLPRNAKA